MCYHGDPVKTNKQTKNPRISILQENWIVVTGFPMLSCRLFKGNLGKPDYKEVVIHLDD